MKNRVRKLSSKLTSHIGSPASIVLHTIFFVGIFSLHFWGISFSDILLVLTTIVSLEAIYLSIFIQMTVNKHAEELEEVSEDIEGIQEDVGEIQEDVDAIQEDVGELQEDVEEITEDEETLDDHGTEMKKLEKIESTLQSLLEEIAKLKK
jgi:uncharacterized protein YoxC